ncbi:MAG: hypothetical protein ACR5LD_05985 [Symbiopectobacterium sp.]
MRSWGVRVADLYTQTDGLLFDSLNSKLFFIKTEATTTPSAMLRYRLRCGAATIPTPLG